MARRNTTTSSGGPKAAAGRTSRPRPTSTHATCISSSIPSRTDRWWWNCHCRPGASFYGTIEDAWYVPLVDIGFEGKGGKYLVLPPDFKGEIPEGTRRYVPTCTTP